jgi:ketosteroid isomerase-like protein
MTEQKTTTDLDFETIRRGIEQLDAETLIGLCADDAELQAVNRYAPPSSPEVLRGKKEIAEHLRNVCGQDIKARVEREVVGEDGMAYILALKYPDDTRLLCTTVLDVRDGKIVREVGVRAWDE